MKTDSKPCQCHKWFVRSCAVYVLTCIIGLACCAYCTYIVHNASKIFIVPAKETFNDKQYYKGDDDAIHIETIGGIEDSREHLKERRTRDVNIYNINENKDSDSEDDIKKNKKERKQRNKKRRGEGKKKGKRRSKLMAAHYMLKPGIHDPGASCPISSQVAPHTMSHLRHFVPAPFVQDKTNPLKHVEGKFVVQSTGLYLVYAQILFEDCREDQIMVVVQKRDDVVIQEHFCFVGVSKSAEKYNNTCSVTALFYMEQGDVLAMENYYPEVHINYRSYNSTFIGAVLLK